MRAFRAVRRSLTLPSSRHVIGWWIGTRVIVFVLWAVSGFQTQGDLHYYHESIASLFAGVAPSAVLIEYPTPLIWVLCLPYLLGGGTWIGFCTAFIVCFVATDAAVAWVLWRTARKFGTDPRPAVGFWIGFVIAMGPITYMRLDLLTAALGAAAILALVRSHRFTSGTMIGLGAALKLWPALLWPATMTDRRAIHRATVGVFGTGAVLVLVSIWYAGWDRLISPLTWQSDRGLQIESVYTTPLMVVRLFDPGPYTVRLSKYQAFELAGPGTIALTDVATAATLIGGLLMLAIYIGWLRRPCRTPIEAGALMITATLIMIVTNKTLSPQYMMWLAGPVAGLLTISARRPTRPTFSETPRGPMTLARQIAWWTIGLTIATQLVYPILYWQLIHETWLTPVATVVLLLRNGGLVYFAIRLVAFVIRSIAWPRRLPEGTDDGPSTLAPETAAPHH